jgi:hypothetical protein
VSPLILSLLLLACAVLCARRSTVSSESLVQTVSERLENALAEELQFQRFSE